MKKIQILAIISVFILSISLVHAQKVYSVTSGEMIFSFADVKFTQEFLDAYPGAAVVKNPLRYTVFFHIGQYWHIDFGNNVGLISGIGLRNVGFISDETLPEMIDNSTGVFIDYKIIRRTYALGVPLMLKFGSFKDHLYFFGGAEYELAFHFKEKYWTNTHDRSGTKTKSSEWFGDQMPTFLPSVIGGIQLPGGVNIKFKYYLADFLNHKYETAGGNASTYSVSNLNRYETSQVFYLSLSWQFNTAYITKKEWQSTDIARR
jgi:hypothetical protein